jgi:hypothetical protein
MMTTRANPRSEQDLHDQFGRLAAEWKKQSILMSNSAQMALLKPYQQIIGMGPVAVPFILEALQREPDHWFWALESITGENPVPPEANGVTPRMADAWVDWGRARGLLPR